MVDKTKKEDGAPRYIMDLFSRKAPEYLANLFHRREKKVRQLEKELKEARTDCADCVEEVLCGLADSERYLSYVIVNEKGRIVGSTPTFRKRFGFNDPEKPIIGQLYSKALKFSDVEYDYKLEVKKHLVSSERIQLESTIYTGTGEEVMIRFEKYPSIRGTHKDMEHFYTRIDVYDIGMVKRRFNQVLRKLHVVNGHPTTIEEFVREKIIQSTREKADEEAAKIIGHEPKKKGKS